MLHTMTCASPPCSRMPLTTASHASALRLETTTLAPSCASSSAEARPMPRLEPVTTATLPLRSNGDFIIALALFYERSVLEQAALRRDPAQMMVGVAEHRFDDGQPLEVVADLVLLRHADAA